MWDIRLSSSLCIAVYLASLNSRLAQQDSPSANDDMSDLSEFDAYSPREMESTTVASLSSKWSKVDAPFAATHISSETSEIGGSQSASLCCSFEWRSV